MDAEYGPAEGEPATPGLAPPEPTTGPATRLDVDGESFALTSGRQPGTYDYTWLTGPNEGYGFSLSTGAASGPPTLDAHHQSIRGFLAMVDPKTGFIGDD